MNHDKGSCLGAGSHLRGLQMRVPALRRGLRGLQMRLPGLRGCGFQLLEAGKRNLLMSIIIIDKVLYLYHMKDVLQAVA